MGPERGRSTIDGDACTTLAVVLLIVQLYRYLFIR